MQKIAESGVISPSGPATTSGSLTAAIRKALPVTAAVWGAGVLMLPITYWRHGLTGVGVAAASALVITTAAWLGIWVERSLSAGGHTLAGLLAPSAVRMILPLAFALIIVTWGRAYVPPQVVLYIVPLYLTMLVVETAIALQLRKGSNWATTDVPRPLDSANSK